MRPVSRSWLTVALAGSVMVLLAVASLSVASWGHSAPAGLKGIGPGLRADVRAAAVAGLLDAPAGQRAVEEGLAVAEALRRRFSIDTGNVSADNLAAARRAVEEVLEPLRATPEQVEQAARRLGYSLEPAACANYCENVYRLALLELHKEALRRAARAPAL